MVDRSTLMGVSPADCPLFFFREHRPIAALREICVAICCNIEEYIRVDQRHRLSPRLSAMIASVVSPLVAVPRSRSKRLGLCAYPATASSYLRPQRPICSRRADVFRATARSRRAGRIEAEPQPPSDFVTVMMQ